MDRHALTSIDPIVLGERIAEARRARRFTQQHVADAIGATRTTIVAIEKGERRPRAAELLQFARLFGVAIRDFVRTDSDRQHPDFIVHFRATRSDDSSGDREADIKQFERLCRWYVELEEALEAPLPMRYPEVYHIAGTPPERAAEEVALSERNRLGLGDGPVGDLTGLLETDVGLRVFSFPFRDNRAAGFFLYVEEYGGCIAVNSKHPEERRRWSVAHEYGHFLVHRLRPEIAVLVPSKRRKSDEERFADAFARNFLMPVAGLQRRFDSTKRANGGSITPADVLNLSHLYAVSFQAMAWRLEELRLLPAGTWELLEAKGFKPNKARLLLNLPPIIAEWKTLPQRYVTLCVRAYSKGWLSEGQLAERLATDRVGAREIVAQWTTQSEPIEDGEWQQISLDFSTQLVNVS